MAQKGVRVKLNPALLTWARESAGLDIPSVARTIGVSAERLASWEQGEEHPTVNQLEGFARKVHRPLAALFLASPPQEPRPPRDFRRLPGSELSRFSPKALLAFRDARNTLRDAEPLFAEMEFAPQYRLPHAFLRDDTTEVAHQVRATLGVSVEQQFGWADDYVALRNWRDAVLDYGVLVLQYPLPPEEIRGFSIGGDGLSVIGVSSQDPPVARVFSLFHELYHLCLGKPGVSGPPAETGTAVGPRGVVERLCNAFAADLLVPLDDEHLSFLLAEAAVALPANDQPVRTLAAKLKVSKYVVLRRLLEAGLISQTHYADTQNLWLATDKHRKPAGFSRPDTRSISKSGPRFSALVMEALDAGQISEREACALLSLSPKWLGDVRNRLFSGGPDE